MESNQSTNQAQELDGHQPAVLDKETSPASPTADQSSTARSAIAPKPSNQHPYRRRLIVGAVGIGLIMAGIFGYRWWRYAATHAETDDAYVTTDVHPINARINGTVTAVAVNDNQQVQQGELLVKLDPRDYDVALQQAQAALASSEQQARVAQANIGVNATNAQGLTTQAQGNIDAAAASVSTSQAALAEAQAGVPAAQAQLAQVKASLVKAQLDYQRYTALVREGAASQEQLDAARATYESTLGQYKALAEQIKQAQARVVQAQKNLDNAQAKLSSTQGGLQQAAATSKQTEVNRRQYQ